MRKSLNPGLEALVNERVVEELLMLGATPGRLALAKELEDNEPLAEWVTSAGAPTCWVAIDCVRGGPVSGIGLTRDEVEAQAIKHYNATGNYCSLFEGDLGGDDLTQRGRYPTTARLPDGRNL